MTSSSHRPRLALFRRGGRCDRACRRAGHARRPHSRRGIPICRRSSARRRRVNGRASRTFDGSQEIAVFPGDLPRICRAAGRYRVRGGGGASDGDLRFIRFRPPAIEVRRRGQLPPAPHSARSRAAISDRRPPAMNDPSARKPAAFDADDPAARDRPTSRCARIPPRSIPDPRRSRDRARSPPAPRSRRRDAVDGGCSGRPVSACWCWSLAWAVTRLVEDLFARSAWLGGLGLTLAAIAASALAVLDRARGRGSRSPEWRRGAYAYARSPSVESDDREQGRALVADLIGQARRIPQLARVRCPAGRPHLDDIIDGRDLVRIAERELMATPRCRSAGSCGCRWKAGFRGHGGKPARRVRYAVCTGQFALALIRRACNALRQPAGDAIGRPQAVPAGRRPPGRDRRDRRERQRHPAGGRAWTGRPICRRVSGEGMLNGPHDRPAWPARHRSGAAAAFP
jgi:hypothetical protein